MTTQLSSSLAACAYCGEHARPNAAYCLACGQLLAPAHIVSSTRTAGSPPISVAALNTSANVRTHMVLLFADGRRCALDASAANITILGRDPSRSTSYPGAHAVAIVDPTRSVSRTHAIINLHSNGATVTDTGSTNGSAVERNGIKLRVTPGRQCALHDGDCLWLGSVPVEIRLTKGRHP